MLPQQDSTDYSKTVDDLVKVRSKPVEKMEEQQKDNEKKTTTLTGFVADMALLKQTADKVYGFDSGFKKKTFSSSNPDALEGEALEGAVETSHKIRILSLAKEQQLASEPIKVPDNLPSSNFTFKVGEKTYDYFFGGGSVKDLQGVLAIGNKPLRLFVIKMDQEKSILLLGTNLTGAANKIDLLKDSGNLFSSTLPLFKSSEDRTLSLLDRPDGIKWPDSTKSFLGKKKSGDSTTPEAPKETTAKDDVLSLSPGESVEIPGVADSLSPASFLSLTLSWDNAPVSSENPSATPSSAPSDGSSSKAPKKTDPAAASATPSAAPLPPTGSVKLTVSYEIDGDLEQKIYTVDMSDFFQVSTKAFRVDLDSLFASHPGKNISLKSVVFSSLSLPREVKIEAPSLFLKGDSSKSFAYVREVSAPQNAVIEYEGLTIERDNNDIKDVVPRVRLSLKKVNEDGVSFSIGSDKEENKNRLVNFLGQYNTIVHKINLLSSRGTPPTDLSEEEKGLFGLFQSERYFLQLRSELTDVLIKPYGTSDPKISMLSQAGISSLISPSTPQLDKGKIDFNESKYDQIFSENPDLVAELFGFDANNDGIIDSGFAFEVTALVQKYTARGGVFAMLGESFGRVSKNLKDKIEKEKQAVDAFREKQERDFSKLQSAQAQMKKMQQMLDSYK